MLEDKRVDLGTAGGQAGVLGATLAKRKPRGRGSQRCSLPSLLSTVPPSPTFIYRWAELRKKEFASASPTLASPGRWITRAELGVHKPQLVLLWDAWDVGQGPRIWPPRLRLQSLSLGTVSAGPQHIPGKRGKAKYLENS